MNLVGKVCIITTSTSWACGEWGTIKDFDGDYYYVAIADDPCSTLVFSRSEFKVRKVVWE